MNERSDSPFASNLYGHQRPIYLDHHATTPVDPRVAAVVLYAMTTAFGNPHSADHGYGDEAHELVEAARSSIAALLGCEAQEVFFTSGASESVRIAINHAVKSAAHHPARIVASPLEHRAVLDALGAIERAGRATIEWLAVDAAGKIKLESLDALLARGADVVCAMAANNELGNVYPVAEIAERAANVGAVVVVDATQAAGKTPICVREWGVTYLALSAHKIYGPKGVGALIVHEPQRRFMSDELKSGTPNVPGIAGLGEACRLRAAEMVVDEARISTFRDRLETRLRAAIPDLCVNGDLTNRLAGSLHIAVPSIPNDAVLARLRERLAVSTGAACSSGADAPSHVLRAIGLDEELQAGAFRIGLGKFTTEQEVDAAAVLLIDAVHAVREAMSLAIRRGRDRRAPHSLDVCFSESVDVDSAPSER